MKFGLFYLPTYLPQARDAATHFDNIVEQVLFADEIGIEYVWMVEHHFVRHGGLCAANFALLSYLAGRTKRIRLGSGATVLALNDPVRATSRTTRRPVSVRSVTGLVYSRYEHSAWLVSVTIACAIHLPLPG